MAHYNLVMEKSVHCTPVGSEERVHFLAYPGQLTHVFGRFYRMRVKDMNGVGFWLVLCQVNKTGLLLPLEAFDMQEQAVAA